MLSKIAAAVCVVMLVLGLYGLAWSQACNVGPGKTYSDGDGVYDGADIQLALNAGANAILCQNTTYNLDEPRLTCGVGIATCFKFSNQEIYTDGSPTDATRAIMKITTVNVWVAVKGRNISGVKLHHVQIDGNRPTLGHRIGGGNALVYMGGDASGQQVTYTKISHTRTWSSLHFQEGDNKLCSGATVSNNTIGPAGCDKDRNGCAAGDATKSWADGISLACKNSTVSGDTITDATDGSIVIFGAPGSSVTSNTIEVSTRILLGGINLVDCDPFFYNDGTFKGGDYSNVTVSSNTIKATGKRIDVGIGQGPYVWGGFTSCPCGDTNNRNKNAMVRNNTLPQSANFGYGYVVDGVQGWTTFGNGSNATHSGSADDCASGSASATAKLKHSGHSSGTWCDSQGQQCDVYTEGVAHGVLASN